MNLLNFCTGCGCGAGLGGGAWESWYWQQLRGWRWWEFQGRRKAWGACHGFWVESSPQRSIVFFEHLPRQRIRRWWRGRWPTTCVGSRGGSPTRGPRSRETSHEAWIYQGVWFDIVVMGFSWWLVIYDRLIIYLTLKGLGMCLLYGICDDLYESNPNKYWGDNVWLVYGM